MTSTLTQSVQTAAYAKGTFLPGDTTQDLDDLLEAAWRSRLTTFLVVFAESCSLCPEDCETSGFLSAASDLINADQAQRRAIISDPVCRVWVGLAMRDLSGRLTGRVEDPRFLRNRLNEFSAMIDRVREAAKQPSRPLFHRLDVDPLVATVLLPSYEVPQDPAELKARSQLGHPLSFVTDVVGIALDRIQATWPRAREHFDRLVYEICYLPDADFRSCSASRYTGIILISNRDRSVLDLEESLVHEAGHQLLYHICEIQPVSDGDVKDQYKLPWSGQVRDFYGYFHAFYIYVLLAQYHERAMELRSVRDGDAARERLRYILRGLIAALPDFQANPHLTPQGRELIEALAEDIHSLEARRRSLLV